MEDCEGSRAVATDVFQLLNLQAPLSAGRDDPRGELAHRATRQGTRLLLLYRVGSFAAELSNLAAVRCNACLKQHAALRDRGRFAKSCGRSAKMSAPFQKQQPTTLHC